MNTANKTFKNGNQQGVALLFALGIISLLLVLALAFVTNAAVNRRIAANNTAKSQTDTLASAAVQRVIALLNLKQKFGAPQEIRELVSFSQLDGVSSDDLLNGSGGSGLLAVPKYSNAAQFVYDPSVVLAAKQAKWQFIKDSSGRLVGRYAYAVLPDPARVDLLASSAAAASRLGASSSEIQRDDFTAWTTPGAGKRWLSYDVAILKNKANLPSADLVAFASSADRDTLLNQYLAGNPPDIELYWYDVNGSNAQDHKYLDGTDWKSEFFHRFQLNRTDWDTVTIDNLLGAPEPLVKIDGTLNVGTQDGNKISQFSSNAIPYLRRIGNDKGTYATLTARRKQVAANLIAYNRVFGAPVTDDASLANSTCFGNVRSPYLDRFGFNLSAACIRTNTLTDYFGPGDNLYVYTLNADLKVSAELINIFTVASGAAAVDISNFTPATLSVVLPAGALDSTGGSALASPLNATVAIPQISFASGVGANSYDGPGVSVKETVSASLTGTTFPLQFALRGGVDPSASVGVSLPGAIQFDRITVSTGGQVSDYVRGQTATGTLDLTFDINGSSSGKSIVFSVTQDPQENLNPGDWTEGLVNEESTVTFPVRTPAPTFHAYIRHAVMKSPGELAYIGRGEPWSMLNLTASNTGDVNKIDCDLETAGTTYADGDAEILDQVKMTADVSSYGKVDLSGSPDSDEHRKGLKMLLQNTGYVTSAAEYANMVPAAPQITGAIATQIALELDTVMQGKNYRNRSAVAADLLAKIKTQSGFGTLAAPQDSELIGKILPLTKAGEFPNVIRLIVVSQSIRDLGGPDSTTTIRINKIKPSDGSTVFFDVTTGKFDLDGGVYFDEITGQSKALVTLVRDPITNKYHVASTDYLD